MGQAVVVVDPSGNGRRFPPTGSMGSFGGWCVWPARARRIFLSRSPDPGLTAIAAIFRMSRFHPGGVFALVEKPPGSTGLAPNLFGAGPVDPGSRK